MSEAWTECKNKKECVYVMYANLTNKYHLRTEKDKEYKQDDEDRHYSWIQFECASNKNY